MTYWTHSILAILFLCHQLSAESLDALYLGSRETDPSTLVENVSVIRGDYTEIEVDLKVASPDPLILSRFYSSQDSPLLSSLGGWRFLSHCFLTLSHDEKGGRYARVGTPEGSIFTYKEVYLNANAPQAGTFQVDLSSSNQTNNAREEISAWTNPKNNKLYYHTQTDQFELLLCNQGRRFYKREANQPHYHITHEILPSGNKIFYEFDSEGRVTFIRQTNAAEQKDLAWIQIQYSENINVKASDGKEVTYFLERENQKTPLLIAVFRSHKPALYYEYQAQDQSPLLIRKNLPEGRYVKIEYAKNEQPIYKVKAVSIPIDFNQEETTHFSYQGGFTEVVSPGDRKVLYHFDESQRLIAIEQFLDGVPYRIYQKTWGKNDLTGNLISTSIADGNGTIFYHKFYVYDQQSRANISEEHEYGDLTGNGSVPLLIDEEGKVINQDGHAKYYSYFSGKDTDGFFQKDLNGSGIKYWYKKGTNLLVKKFLLRNGSSDSEVESYFSDIRMRYFYQYNEDAALTLTLLDDGYGTEIDDFSYVTERKITRIVPKLQIPALGTPEIIEQKYSLIDEDTEQLLTRTIYRFDKEGQVIAEDHFDANNAYQYTLEKKYENGLLVSESNALGTKTLYSYDENQNLTSVTDSSSQKSEYFYDLKNRIVKERKKGAAGSPFETRFSYDLAGHLSSEIDSSGNQTTYRNDNLGRILKVTYPSSSGTVLNSENRSYFYTYDLFDHVTSITDPENITLNSSYTVKGKPSLIQYRDGSTELFKYDSGGNLHHHCYPNGLLEIFEYDYLGRITHISSYANKEISTHPFKKLNVSYTTFHKECEIDPNGIETVYIYDQAGRLQEITKGSQKTSYAYDSLGRIKSIQQWKSPKKYIRDIWEYDLLNRIIEERTENNTGEIFLKKNYVYHDSGELAQVIGYPNQEESVLVSYEYDDFARLSKITTASGETAYFKYEDSYVDERGQRGKKRVCIDFKGNETEEIFNFNDQLIKTCKKDAKGHLISEQQFAYDSIGKKVRDTYKALSLNGNSKDFEVRYTYDTGEHLSEITQAKGSTQERTSRYLYNSRGFLIEKYQSGQTTPVCYKYRDSGHLEWLTYQENQEEKTSNFQYDTNENLLEVSHDDFCLNYTYDDNDLPLSETIEDAYGSYEVKLLYDGTGKIKRIILPDNSYIQYAYKGPFVKSITRFNNQKKELYSHQIHTRDLMGNILEEGLPGKLGVRHQNWDKAARRVSISTPFFKEQVIKYGLGNQIQEKETEHLTTSYRFTYESNSLSQITYETGFQEHSYLYDSIGNRLQKDEIEYAINELNELVSPAQTQYSYDSNGNPLTKITENETWQYRSNPLNHIVSVKKNGKNLCHFKYDLSGRRLSKKARSFDQTVETQRYFYLGKIEIGCIDEKGRIQQLKVPLDPNENDSPCIAIELQNQVYIPLQDLQGNNACLVNLDTQQVVEFYLHTAFGEEEIFNNQLERLHRSSIGNPWRYRNKRIDEETGLIYFGYRYYDPVIGRWLSPDPLGMLDGPNLYAYVHNNPIQYTDIFGLYAQIDENCGCIYHNHPGWENAPSYCVCICGRDSQLSNTYRLKRGSNLKSALAGATHGVVDFAVESLHDLQTMTAYIGSSELDLSLNERSQIIHNVEQAQTQRMSSMEEFFLDAFSVDENDIFYHTYRNSTIAGLEVASLASAVYGITKGVISLNHLFKSPSNIDRLTKYSAKTDLLINRSTCFSGRKNFPLDYAKYQPIRNRSKIINNRKYTGHSLDRMQDRGFTPSIIENALMEGQVYPGKYPAKIEYYDSINRIRVLLNEEMEVITVIPGERIYKK